MGKIIGVLFNGGEQILCHGELSTVIDEQLKVEPAEENKAEDEKKPKEKK